MLLLAVLVFSLDWKAMVKPGAERKRAPVQAVVVDASKLDFEIQRQKQLVEKHQATLAMVAPGIAEALIAIAMGLFVAIPAVIAYNRYSNDVERLENRYDNFLEEFSSILQRQAHD